MNYEMAITVDANDGDYLTEITNLTDEELDYIKPLIDAISKWSAGHNYMYGECAHVGEMLSRYPGFGEGVHEALLEHCPYGEYGFHTIESIYVYPVPEKTKLL